MSHSRPPLPGIFLVLLLVLGTAAYFLWQEFQPPADTRLTASGTVETVQTSIAPEIGGKVLDVMVDSGDFVRAGDVLLRLDASLHEAQYALAAASLDTAKSAVTTAEAALASAQVQYDLTVRAALTEESALRAADWKLTKPTDFNEPSWYFSRAEQLSAFEAESVAAQEALKKAEERLDFYQQKAASNGFCGCHLAPAIDVEMSKLCSQLS